MKVVLLCAVLTVASGLENFFKKQTDVLDILDRVHERSFVQHIQDTARSYYPGDFPDNYNHFKQVKEWLSRFHDNKWRERDIHFNLFNPEQRREAVEMFEVFMLAKTYDAFFSTACWAREHANQMIFTYAYTVAVLNRPDTAGLYLPPMYEINPHFFTSTDVIQEAYSAKMKQVSKVIPMAFTGTPVNTEQWVAYFGEDIGLNNHHFHWHADFPFWWKRETEFQKDRKGELFFYAHHMLTTRFDLERISNGLDPVAPLHWDKPIVEGFAPHTTYRTEGEFPFRPDDMEFQDLPFLSIQSVKDMEYRILDAIDIGYYITDNGERVDLNNTEGINHLGELIESSTFSQNPSYYGSLHNLAHVLLSRVSDPTFKYGLPPGVMEHFETATRDPSFFRLHKYMDNIFKRHKHLLPPYTHDELEFPGVTINSVELTGSSEHSNELITFFDDFEFDLTNALDTNDKVGDVDIKARVKRLNHESFTYNIEVNSEHEGTAVVRIFLGAADTHDSHHHDYWNTVELDRFKAHLGVGLNQIKRKSTESSATIPDRYSFKTLRAKVAAGSLDHKPNNRHCGYPQRLLLPKGNTRGVDFNLYVVLTDFEHDKVEDSSSHDFSYSISYCGALNEKILDKRPMGFPLDRRVDDDVLEHLGNFHKHHVVIKHRH